MSANYPAGWAPLSSHSAVAMPNEYDLAKPLLSFPFHSFLLSFLQFIASNLNFIRMWIFGGKLKTNASGATWHVPLPRLLTQTKTCGVYFNQRQENVAITCPKCVFFSRLKRKRMALS